MPRFKVRTINAILLACGGLQACGYSGTEGGQTIAGGLRSEMRDIGRSIEQEVGDASAKRIDQCRVYPVGEKPCGGPQSFVVYSSMVSNEHKLEELARQYTEAEQKYNRVTQAVSTCSYLMPPEVRLENGKCTSNVRQPRKK